jgi:serine protease Do
LKLGLDRVQGAWVETVYEGTPADKAGLRAGDVVLQVETMTVRNENHLINWISAQSPGQKIRLEVWRERKLITLEAVIGDWSRDRARFRGNP